MTVLSAKRTSKVRITEIFLSLQGESTRVGLPTVFVRLTGCPLRCSWCDTEYAFHGGQSRDIADVITEVESYGVPHVCVTGGEPLAQQSCIELLSRLCDARFSVSLETSGALDITPVDRRVSRIMDLKAPGSGEVGRNRLQNLDALASTDEIKFVLSDEVDYRWAVGLLKEHRLNERCAVLFSPVAGMLDPTLLAEWIVRDRLPVRFQLQLHKLLWKDAQGH